jgi:hypothetical protein
MLSYDKDIISIQVTVKKCMIKPPILHWNVASSGFIIHSCSVTCVLIVCILVVEYLDDGYGSDCTEMYDKTTGYYTRVM